MNTKQHIAERKAEFRKRIKQRKKERRELSLIAQSTHNVAIKVKRVATKEENRQKNDEARAAKLLRIKNFSDSLISGEITLEDVPSKFRHDVLNYEGA